MTESMASLFKVSNAPYGAYDCIHNATALWLDLHKMPLQPLHQYNWNIYYDRKADVFGGNLPKVEILHFLEREYGVEIEKISSFKLPKNKWILIGLNSFNLSYIRELYNLVDQNHYVLARNLGEVIELYDYFYKYYGQVSIEECYQYWLKFSTSISILNVPEKSMCVQEKIIPQISKRNYDELYLDVQTEIFQKINKFEQGRESIAENLQLKRYFGCIRSIALNRERHFLSGSYESEYKMRIQFAWSSLLREYFVISSKPNKDFSKFKKLLCEVFYLERRYLGTFDN